jgi:tetratricopeptide (TPR) repeat protein
VVFKEAILDQIDKQGNLFFFKNKRLLETDDVSDILVLDKRVQFVPFADIKGAGRFEDAERFYLAEIQNRSKALGKWHPQVALSFRHLGELYADQRGFEEKARLAYSTAADIIRAYHKTPTTQRLRDLCDILNLHADLYIKYDRVSGAETILLELIELFKPTQDSSDGVNTTSTTTPDGTTQQLHQTTNFAAFPQQQAIKDALSSMSKISFISAITDSDQLAEISQALDKLARVVSKMNRFQEAERLYLVARHLKEKVFGPDHWQVGRTLNGHAQLLFAQNRLPEAKEMCGRVKAITENSRGLFHSEVGIALDNLARVVSAEHSYDAADAMLQKALEIKIKSLGENHSFVAMTWDHMATNRFQRLLYATANQGGGQSPKPLPAEDLQDIATLYNRALATIEASLGASHSAFAITKSNLAVTTAYLKDWPRAVELGEHALSILSSSLGESHPSVAVAKSNLAFMKSSLVTHPPIIPHDALKTVYHAQYISSSAPERSRIPDKIRQLLEKKGLAVTESNAQKVVDMLKRKKQAQQAQGYGTVGYGTTATKPTVPVTPIMPISLVSPISPSADDYVTEPYGGVPLNTGAPEDGYENAPTTTIVAQDTEYKENDESESEEEDEEDEIQRVEAPKEDDIQELEKRKAELDKLQSDLALLVEQQSSMINQIEQNTTSQQYVRPVKASASSRGSFIDALLQCFGRKEKSSSRAYDAPAPSSSYGSSYVAPGGAMRSLDAAPAPNQPKSEDLAVSGLARSLKDKSEDGKKSTKRKKKSKMDHGKKAEEFASDDDDEDWSSSSSAVTPRATPSSGYENVDEEVNADMMESKMSPRKSPKNLQRDKDRMLVDVVTQPFALSSSSTSLAASSSKESNQAPEGRTSSRSSTVSRGAGAASAARTFSGSTTGTSSSSAMPSPLARKRSRGDPVAQFGESLDARSSFGFAPAQSQQQAAVAPPTKPTSGAEEKQHKAPMPSPVSAPAPSVMPPPVVMALPPTMPAPTPAAMPPPPPPVGGVAPPPPVTSPAGYVAPPKVAAKAPPSAYDKYSGYGAKFGDSSSDIPESSSLLYLGGAPSQPATGYAAPVTSLHDAFGPPTPMTQASYFAPSDAGPSSSQISPSRAGFALSSAPSSSGPTIGGGGYPVPQQAQPAQAPRNIPAILPPGSMMQSNVYQHRADDRLRQGQGQAEAAAPLAPAVAKLGRPSVVPHPPPAKQAPGSIKSPLTKPLAKSALDEEVVAKKEVEKGKKDSKNKAPEAPVVASKRKSPVLTNKQSLAAEDERSSPPMGSGVLKKLTKSSKSISSASSSATPSMPSSSSVSPRTQEVRSSREAEVRSSSSLGYLEMPAIESKVVGLGDELSELSALQPTETNIQEESRHRVSKPRRAIVAAKPIATPVEEEKEVGAETTEAPTDRASSSSAIDLSGALSNFRRSSSRLHEDSPPQAGDDWDDPLAQLAAATAAASSSASTGASSSAVPDRDSGGMAQWMDMGDDLENDMAADDILNQVQDEDLDGLELDEDDRGTPAPHTGSSWGWGGI